MTPEEQKLVEEAEQVSASMASPGWKVMQDWCKSIINAQMDRLIQTNDAEETIRLKSDIRAMRWFLLEPDQFITAARKKQAEDLESPAPQANEA
jgi:hypothetical protein